jgi:hypothetical protein
MADDLSKKRDLSLLEKVELFELLKLDKVMKRKG